MRGSERAQRRNKRNETGNSKQNNEQLHRPQAHLVHAKRPSSHPTDYLAESSMRGFGPLTNATLPTRQLNSKRACSNKRGALAALAALLACMRGHGWWCGVGVGATAAAVARTAQQSHVRLPERREPVPSEDQGAGRAQIW